MKFKSDNTAAIHPEILQAIVEANSGNANAYGNDGYSHQLTHRLSEIFDHEVQVYLTFTGTAANSLALSTLVQPYEAIYCHQHAHINTDECGAPEWWTNGAKLIGLNGKNGKLDVLQLQEVIRDAIELRPHAQRPGAISLTQATESGTVYSLKELRDIYDFAQTYQLPIHMDGARFANALVSLGCTPAEMTWKSGVDILSLGATKNGALCAEALVFFNSKYAQNFDYRHKQSGQLASKMRFFATQFLAYLSNDLWLSNAKHANAMAQQLAHIFNRHQITIEYPVESNELFVRMSDELARYLTEHSIEFYEWAPFGTGLYRLVTSWMTREEEVQYLAHCLEKYKK